MSAVTELYTSESLTARVAAEVRSHAAKRGLRQKDLAGLLKISQAQISARFKGRVPFSLDDLDVLAAAFGIDPAELLPRRPADRLARALDTNENARPGETGSGEVRRQGLEPRTRWFGVTLGVEDLTEGCTLAPVIPLRSREIPRPGDWHATTRGADPGQSDRETLHAPVASCS